jgi:hypothetical protein
MTQNTDLNFLLDNDADSTENDNFSEVDTSNDEALISSLVGEGKKFKTIADLARGKLNSDRFISQLTSEKKAVQEELQRRVKMEELMTKLEASVVGKGVEGNTAGNQPTGNQDNRAVTKETKTLTEEDVRKILETKDKEATERANVTLVANEVSRLFGKDANRIVQEKMKEFDLTNEQMNLLAKERPQAFLKIVSSGMKTDNASGSPDITGLIPKSSISAAGMRAFNGALPKKFSDFEKLRRTDPRAYSKPEVQNEIFNLTKEYGAAFLNS